MSKIICSVSGLEFDTFEEYCDHVSPVTGFKPSQIEHQDALTNGKASKIAEKALTRGKAKKEKKEKKK
jgi:hypothetical protein